MLVKQGYWEEMRSEMIRYPAHLMRGGWPCPERWNTDIAFLSWFWNPQWQAEAVLIKMLLDSAPGEVKRLPALPKQWPVGTLEGALCRGQIQAKKLHLFRF